MSEIWTMGEILVEIMRPKVGMHLYEAGEFLGPYPSAAPAIFIDTVARLNHSAGIIGAIGDDDFGKCLIERLKNDGVDCKHIKIIPDKSTAVAFVTYFDDGSRKFIYHIDGTAATVVKAPNKNDIDNAKYFHVMGCSLMINDDFYSEIISTMQEFVSKGARVSFDPNIRKELLKDKDINHIIEPIMRNCSVLLPGVDELLMITGEDTVEKAVEKVFKNKVTEIIALKRGSKGCTVYTRSESFNLGVYPVESTDPTGAGDSFDAAFLCGLLENKSLIETAKMASAAAALNTSAFGPMEGNISVNSVNKMVKVGKLNE